MRVLISGTGGMIGRAVTARLRALGHEVHALVRDPRNVRPGDVLWRPEIEPDPAQIAVFDALVHLAGSPVARRWTEAVKAEIRDSRVAGTRNLALAVARARTESGRPEVLVCASAAGYYGSRGGEAITEESGPGAGFLAEVCRQWEEAAQPAARAGVRLVHLRLSMVLSTQGGALAAMLPGFRLGLAGKFGSGRQWWSWISLEDATRAFLFALACQQLTGAVNLAAPNVVTNAEFTRTLGRVLRRPTLLAVPAWALRLATGEMADEMLLASQYLLSRRLLEAGFHFEDSELKPTLCRLLASAPHPSA